MMLIGLPSTLPPKSSIAICAAVTEPWPVGVAAGPFMSVSTPILTTSSETCAGAAVGASIAAASAASMDRVLANVMCPPVAPALAVLLPRRLDSANWSHLQLFEVVNEAGSGRKPDLPSGRRVVAGEFGGALLQPPAADKTDQRLNRRAEIAALPHQQIKMIPKQRDKIEP